jgi:hypothetical protein
MSAYHYAYTLTPGGPTGARSTTFIGAAIVAVCILSSTLVMRELAGAQPEPAATAAISRTWDLQPRWWPYELRQVTRPAPPAPENDLTFSKGYAQRVAARQVALAAQFATNAPPADSRSVHTAMLVHKASKVARADEAPNLLRVSTARIDGPGERSAQLDFGTHALAFGEQRPSQHGFAEPQGGPFGSLFGNLN